MCLKVGHICDTISCLAWTTFVRCEDRLPFAAYGVQEFEKIVHGSLGAPGTDMATFPLKKTASPAMCVFWYPLSFRADKVSHVTWLEMTAIFQLVKPETMITEI